MKTRTFALIGRLVSFSLLGAVLLAPLASAQEWDPDRFMSVDELARILAQDKQNGRDTRGVVRTVIEGTKIDTLNVKILSIERNSFAKGDLIWAVGLGDRFVHMGTAGGMSGSPVYVQGKMIGALAYGFSNAKDPFIGITPIEQMLRVWQRDMTPKPIHRKRLSSKVGLKPFVSPEEWVAALANPHSNPSPLVTDEVVRANPELDYARGVRLTPIETPVVLRGFRGPGAKLLEGLFGRFGMAVLESVGGGNVDAKVTVEPGTTIGMEYIRGDLSAFGYGTVTYRNGDRILAFGHPMFEEGRVYLPLSAGYVHFVVGSRVRSFKMAGPTRVVGTLVQDRESAIAAVLGEKTPPYMPLTVNVHRNDDNSTRTYQYEIVRHPSVTAGAAMSAVASTLSAAEKGAGEYTVRAKATIAFDPKSGYDPLVKENIFSGQFSPGFAAASVLFPINTILNNWYDEIPIDRVTLDLEYDDARNSAAIINARLSKQKVRPGQTVELTVTYQPYLDDPIVERYPITVPEGAPEGFALLFLGDPDAYEGWERSRARDRYQATNARQLLDLLARGGSQQQLVVSIMTPMKMGIAVDGMELPNLPLSMLNVMNTPVQSGENSLTRGTVLVEKTFPTPFVLSGSTVLAFTIDPNAR